MATETKIQSFIHKLEEGGWAHWIRFALLAAAVAAVYSIFIFSQFRGLPAEKAIDQAQIAREIARGHGFTTKMLRPLALWQFQRHRGGIPIERTPETYHAPLNPYVNAMFIKLAQSTWKMTPKDIVYTSDRIIAALAMAFFILSVAINFAIAKRLFDRRLALLGMGLLLACNLFWQFSLSGLPQMLMLLLFSGANYAMVRAIEEKHLEKPYTLWIALCGLLYGLLALTNGLSIWIFLGALVFAAFYFRPVGKHAAILLVLFLVVYSPFLARNWMVCGSPLGVSVYSALYQICGSESAIMRFADRSQLDLINVGLGAFRTKIFSQIIGQFDELYSYLGQILVAPAFFFALLHLFKRPESSAFRWCVLLMWLGALLGMSVFGLDFELSPLQANNLHVLFIPLMVFYGMAFILVLWTRLEINVRLVRIGFISAIYLLSSIPLITTLLAKNYGRVQWPPYVPPFIAILNTWTYENEVIASDMPWAVAWYADRKSLWLPMTLNDFIAFHDYNRLGGKLVGLYLTPVTGNERFISDIVKGEYKEWAPFILRNVSSKDFPLRAVTALPIDNECIYYSDTDRWSEKID